MSILRKTYAKRILYKSVYRAKINDDIIYHNVEVVFVQDSYMAVGIILYILLMMSIHFGGKF